MKYSLALLALVFLLAGLSVSVRAQEFPEMQADIQTASIELRPDFSSEMLSGSAVFDFLPKAGPVNRLVFQVRGLQIDSVLLSGTAVAYSLHSDSLLVSPENPVSQRFDIAVFYRSTRSWSGIHRVNDSLFVSSRQPLAPASWMPVIYHPSVYAQITFSMWVPSRFSVVTSGQQIAEDTLSGLKKVTSQTSGSIRLSDFSWTAGVLRRGQFSDSERTVLVFAAPALKMQDSLDVLAGVTSKSLISIEEGLNQKNECVQIQMVILPDLFWESRPSSAGLSYISPYQGNVLHEIREALAAQWLGGLLFPVDAAAAVWIASARQSLLSYIFGADFQNLGMGPKWLIDDVEPIKGFQFSEAVLKRWARGRGEVTAEELLQWAWEADGLSHFGLKSAGIPEKKNGVIFGEWKEGKPFAKLLLSMDSLAVPVEASLKLFRRRDTLSIPISLRPDSVIELEMRPEVKNFLIVPSGSGYSIVYTKPEALWITQIRGSKEVRPKIEGIKALQKVRNNPDLQLFLHDLLRSEKNQQVRAQSLATLAVHLNGATGSAGLFLNELTSADTSVKRQAVLALRYYGVNADHAARIQSELRRSNPASIRSAMIQSLSSAMDSTAWIRWSERQFSRIENPDLFEEIVTATEKKFSEVGWNNILNRWLELNVQPWIKAGFAEKISRRQSSATVQLERLLESNDARIHAVVLKMAVKHGLTLTFTSESKERILQKNDTRTRRLLEIISDIPPRE